ncbi:BTB/Kelch-associated [Trinorchestia longiramus]|nr:BTB/Kelch-associated [Trinorchestia longiramus]
MEEELALLSYPTGSFQKSSSFSDGELNKNATILHRDNSPHGDTEFNFPDFRTDSFKVMLQMRNFRNLTDVILQIGQKQLHVHKIILAAASPYFKAMFMNGMQESCTGLVPLHGVSFTIMVHLVRFMYSGHVFINQQLVCQLLAAASMFQIRHVVNACCKFLEDQIEADNVIGISNFAERNGCLELHAKTVAFIVENFSEVSQSEEFLELSSGQLINLIQKDTLNVPDEEAVYNAVVRWVEHSAQERAEMMHYVLKVARSGLGAVFLRGSLYAVGGRTINPVSLVSDVSSVSQYRYKERSWVDCKSMQQKRNRMGVCVLDNFLYSVGGVEGTAMLKSAERYQPDDDSWHSVAAMKEARGALCCVTVHRLLYAIGGCDGVSRLSSVERYDPDTDTWASVAPLLQARSGAGAAVVGNKIYVVGGYDGSRQINSVERYDPEEDSWTLVAPMLERRSALAVAASCTTIYAMGGFDGTKVLSSTEIYDSVEDKWTEGCPMPFGSSAQNSQELSAVVQSCLHHTGLPSSVLHELPDGAPWPLGFLEPISFWPIARRGNFSLPHMFVRKQLPEEFSFVQVGGVVQPTFSKIRSLPTGRFYPLACFSHMSTLSSSFGS